MGGPNQGACRCDIVAMRAAAAVATRHPLLPALSSWPPPAFAYPQLRELRGIIEHMHIREDSYRKVCACARCGGGGVCAWIARRAVETQQAWLLAGRWSLSGSLLTERCA